MLTSQLLCDILKNGCNKTDKEDKKISPLIEKKDRFETFVILIDSVHKCISKIKQELSTWASVKSVHTLWLYELYKHKGGLTSSELAEKSNIDRSLVSREIRELARGGYIVIEPCEGKRGYNSRITLSETGTQVAKKIADTALEIQQAVGEGIDYNTLALFYETLERLCKNLESYNSRENVSD